MAKGSSQVYMRVNGEHTFDVSASKTPTPDRGALFEGASSDGSRVFFLANYGLASSSSAGKEAASGCNISATEGKYGEGCDLYEYRFSDPSTGAGTLKDLSADVEAQTGDTRGADVRGVVGISADGSSIYFSASGQLVHGKGNSEEQNEIPYPRQDEELRLDEANVYVSHEAGSPKIRRDHTPQRGRERSADRSPRRARRRRGARDAVSGRPRLPRR